MSAKAERKLNRSRRSRSLDLMGELILTAGLLLAAEGCADLLDPVENTFGVPTDCGTTSSLSGQPLACGATLSSTGRLTAERILHTPAGGAGGVGGAKGTNAATMLPLPEALPAGAALRFSGGLHGGMDCDGMELLLVPQSGPFSVAFLAARGEECDGESLAGPYEVTEPTRLTFPAWVGDQDEWVLHFVPLAATGSALSLDVEVVARAGD